MKTYKITIIDNEYGDTFALSICKSDTKQKMIQEQNRFLLKVLLILYEATRNQQKEIQDRSVRFFEMVEEGINGLRTMTMEGNCEQIDKEILLKLKEDFDNLFEGLDLEAKIEEEYIKIF